MAKSEKYEKGSILKFDNKVMDTVIVIGETVKDNEQYILVAPFKEVGKQAVITDKSKLLLLKISDDDNIYVETNKDIVRPILSEILK